MEVKGRLQGPEPPPLLSLYLSSDFVRVGLDCLSLEDRIVIISRHPFVLPWCYGLDVSPEPIRWAFYPQYGSGKRKLPSLNGWMLLLREDESSLTSLPLLSLHVVLWLYCGVSRRPLADTVPPSWMVQPAKP